MSIGGFVAFAVIVAGQNLWQQYDAYYIRYTDTSVSGIQVGGTVIYQGIAVGTIESIHIDPQDVQSIVVEINVQQGTPIKTDVTAEIVPVGITGISQIELSGGTRDAERLDPGSFIAPADSTVTQVTESAQSILRGIETLLADISGVLGQVEEEGVGNILSQADEMVAENRETIRNLLSELESTAAGLASVTREVGRVAGTTSEIASGLESTIASTAPRIDETTQLLADTVRAVNQIATSGEVERMTAAAGSIADEVDLLVRRNASEIEEAVETLNDTLRLLNNFAFQINADPSLLVVPEEQQ
ncbi:MAG: MlaD family protein [Spirochaetota bacterium]